MGEDGLWTVAFAIENLTEQEAVHIAAALHEPVQELAGHTSVARLQVRDCNVN